MHYLLSVIDDSANRRRDRRVEARAAYDRAIELAGNAAEAAYLTRRRDELGT